MTPDQLITVATGVLEGGGIIAFLYFMMSGLKNKIAALNTTIDMQSKTLDVMEKRVEETKGIGQLYKELLNEIPDDLKKYKEFIKESKDAMIDDLKRTILENDDAHKREIEANLHKIHEQEKSINQLIKARESMILADEAIRSGMESISDYYNHEGIGENKALRSIEIYIQHKGDLNIASKSVGTMKLISGNADEPSSSMSNIDVDDVGRIIESEAQT